MTTRRIPDALSSLTAATLTAISGAAPWIAIIVLLPHLLGALTRILTEGLPAITAFRKESMWTKHEDRYLASVDGVTGLPHIERSRRTALPTADQDPASSEDDKPPPGPPP
ncbi:hypothetical protein ACIO93_42580 [Streptomyces sp. NPDC087903]|uniref:hypothetical protein n=1 Tax=Streptomyces sp. NPDC087903 TaxID=3365819 RepID=UPI00382DEEBA